MHTLLQAFSQNIKYKESKKNIKIYYDYLWVLKKYLLWVIMFEIILIYP